MTTLSITSEHGVRRDGTRRIRLAATSGRSVVEKPRAMGVPLELEDPELVTDEVVDEDRPWVVIVWNDPINLMSYVAYVFQKVFGYSKEKANKLMLDVHHKGRAVVSSGTRTEAERDVNRLHGHGLWATMQHDE